MTGVPETDGFRGLKLRTFGDFELFFDGCPVRFRYRKTKEFLACLIDRGGDAVNTSEIKATLWDDDRDRASYIKQIRKDLLDTLRGVGAEDAVVVIRGGMGIVPSRVKCDYFDYLAGEPQGINAFHGEYMQQYSWAEPTRSRLAKMHQRQTAAIPPIAEKKIK